MSELPQPLLADCFQDEESLRAQNNPLVSFLLTAASYIFYRFIKRVFGGCLRKPRAMLRI